jgi:hypothetical protein
MAKRLDGSEQVVFDLLVAAAAASEPCPSNETICRAVGARSLATGARFVAALEAAGVITVERAHKSRVVTIVATGNRTALLASAGPRRADELADLMAEGWNLSAAAVAMGLSRARVDVIWKWICDQLGPQAV